MSALLYFIFTNNIPVSTITKLSLFAVNIMFLSVDKNPKLATIQLQKWFFKWRLRINVQKTVAVNFNQRTNNPKSIRLSGHTIPRSTSAKYLGINLDKRLPFTQHVNQIIQKGNRIRGSLYPILNRRSPIPANVKRLILHLYVRPVTTYGSQPCEAQ